MKPAIFLDRDGVLLENREDYIRSWDEARIYQEALNALAGLSETSYLLILVTNQSAVGRGIISLSDAEAINQALLEVVSGA